MGEQINNLRKSSAEKIKEFEKGIESGEVDYLVAMNDEVNTFVRQHNIKTEDYLKVQKQQLKKGNKNGKKG